MVRVSELKKRDVVSVNDGKRLGYITDLVFDVHKGCVEAIIIPQMKGVSLFGGGRKEHVIPWEKIVRVGIDIILVDYMVDFNR